MDRKYKILIGITYLALAGCSGTTDVLEGPDSNEGTVVSQNSAVSDCGGFTSSGQQASNYCDAEKLLWSFDKAAGVLSLVNTRVVLNCCGEHSFHVVRGTTGVYDALETDTVGGQMGRCRCMCSLDFRTEIKDVSSTSIDLVLRRHITDEGAAKEIWAGTLDLRTATGEVIIDGTPVEFGCKDQGTER